MNLTMQIVNQAIGHMPQAFVFLLFPSLQDMKYMKCDNRFDYVQSVTNN